MRNPFKKKPKITYQNTITFYGSTLELETTQVPSVHGKLMSFVSTDENGLDTIKCFSISNIKCTKTVEVHS